MKRSTNCDLAALLPAGDQNLLPHISSTVEGPVEVTVDDPNAKLAYKRLVHMLVVKGSVSFKLPDPVVKITTAAICEMVLELDNRLVGRQDFEKCRDNPVQWFKSALAEIDSALHDSAVLYGFRSIRAPGCTKPDQMLQMIAKVPFAQRTSLLEASGSNLLLIRDFLDKGKSSADTTILPRFWPHCVSEFQNMRIAVKSVEGFAGVVVTKRGIAPRIWIANISAARTHLLPADARLTKDNLHVVPKFTLELAGWPAATAAEHVVASTVKSLL